MSLAEIEELESMRSEHERALDGLLRISHAVGSVMELESILEWIAKETARIVEADVCSIYLFVKDRKRLRLRASHGLNPEVVHQASIELGEGLAGWVAKTGEVVAVADTSTDGRHKPIEGSGEDNLRAFLCAPLMIQEELIGVMTARLVAVHEFDSSEIKLFETVCKQVAIVIEKARLYQTKVEAERLAAVAVGLSEIAHYAKNLLQSVEGGAFIVEKGLASNDLERVRAGWQLLRRNNKKITDLVSNMLSYSREEEPEFAQGDLNELLREVVEAARGRAGRSDVELAESYDESIPRFQMDEDYLHDSFLNLVTNAIEAIPGSGVVVVRSHYLKDEKRALVEVIDNGQGIPEENREKVFNLFFSTKGAKGTGIGLAATKKRIEAHNGTIDFTSEPGKGTTFHVHLPLRSEPNGLP
jgi:signal transduction histidine kinase